MLSEIRIIGRRELDKYDGWLFGMPGDGLFATFESGVNAVQCALDMQAAHKARPDLEDMPLRIGIHLGEVLINDDLPFGETLNIAARLEALAEPGGILVSGTVMDAVSARISARFEDRGVPHLKNIPRRIPTYAVKPPAARSSTEEQAEDQSNLDRTTRFDRSALREILNEHAAAESSRNQSSSQKPVHPRQDAAQPESVHSAEAAPRDAGVDATTPLASDVSTSTGTSPEPAQPIPKLDEVPSDTAPLNPAPPTLAEKIAAAKTAPDEIHMTDGFELDQSASEPPSYAPIIQQNPKPSSLERALPEAGPPQAAEIPQIAPRGPSPEFLDEITKALAQYVGPFAKHIVNREMKKSPSVFDLITLLENHVPTEEERMSFRVQASHINANLLPNKGS